MNKKQQNNQQKQPYQINNRNIYEKQQQTSQQKDKIKRLYEKLNTFQRNKKNIQQDYKKYESTNTQTNLISLNSSSLTLCYEAVKQKSYLDAKGFKIFEDVNLNTFQPISKYLKNNNKNKLKENLLLILNLIEQLRQLKEQILFQIKQQRIQLFSILQQLKAFIQRKDASFYGNDFIKESLRLSIQQSQQIQNSQQLSGFNYDKFIQLKRYCTEIQRQKQKNQKKFQSTLKSYQTQIQCITNELQKRYLSISNCKKCKNHKDQIQKLDLQSQQHLKYRKIIKNLQQNNQNTVKRLEQQMIILQRQLQLIGKRQIQNKQKFKDRQRQLFFRESEIQYKLKIIEQRQNEINQQKLIILNQKRLIYSKREKLISYDSQLKRQQKFKIKQERQRNFMKSQYYSSMQKKQIYGNYNKEDSRSNSRSSLNKKININQRLNELKVLKNKLMKDSIDNHSRNASKNSEYYISHRNLMKSDHILHSSNKNVSSLKSNQTYQTIRLNQKLQKLSLSLKKDLHQIK